MRELKKKKIGKVFTSKFVGTGPSSDKKRIYRAAVSQSLRNTALNCTNLYWVCWSFYLETKYFSKSLFFSVLTVSQNCYSGSSFHKYREDRKLIKTYGKGRLVRLGWTTEDNIKICLISLRHNLQDVLHCGANCQYKGRQDYLIISGRKDRNMDVL